MTTFILGGGPAGLAIADGLHDSRQPFVLIERSQGLGGLAQTLEWQGAGSHDLGPHKIFSLDAALVRRVEALLPASEWLTREKRSSIFMNGRYLSYPPSPFSLAGVFGFPAFVRMVLGYGGARLATLVRDPDPRTFEEDLVARTGRPLYEVLFRPIAEKLWGDPKDLDVKLSRGRVQTPTLVEVLRRVAGVKSAGGFEALTFRYPRGGLGRIWEAIETKSATSGRFLRGHSVTRLEIEGLKVRAIWCECAGEPTRLAVAEDDFVVSTLPLAQAIHLLGDSLPQHVPSLAEKVVALNDLLLIFLHVDCASLIDESWVFVPDPKIAFHRLSEQESFDPGMATTGSIVCCEIMSSAQRKMSAMSDDELCDAAIRGLADMGIEGFLVKARRVIRLPKSYPVFRAGFGPGLAELMGVLDGFENFRTVGRQGAFNYIGTIDAMDIGYGVADWLAAGGTRDWRLERERTNHYPVLD